MKPVLEYLPLDREESFYAKDFCFPYFPTPWHYHAEYELVLVTESQGKRFIGNHISDFREGDLTLLGPNLPHLYRNSAEFYQPGGYTYQAKSVVVHFLERSLGTDFLALPQAQPLRHLFQLSTQGLDIYGETRHYIIQKLDELLALKGMKRLLCLLNILHTLAESQDYRLISEPGIVGLPSQDTERINEVIEYIMLNFQEPILLKDVADIANLTRTSFCRFFRERTKRSFSDFLTVIRLNHAAKRLRQSDQSILEISYEAGFANLSNFNRHFKDHYQMTPKKYRTQELVL